MGLVQGNGCIRKQINKWLQWLMWTQKDLFPRELCGHGHLICRPTLATIRLEPDKKLQWFPSLLELSSFILD